MPLIYITGPSGSGKTTLTQELIARGYEAHDADTRLCSWYNNETGEKAEYPTNTSLRTPDWQSRHSFLMSETLLRELLQKSKGKTIFICGIAPNDLQLAPKYFYKVLCLMIDEETMINRVTTRTNSKYGQAPDQLAIIQKWYQPTVEKYREFGAVMIDATQPIEKVIESILAVIK